MEELILKIKNKSNDIVGLLGFDAEAIVSKRDNIFFVNFQLDDPVFLIGKGGITLDSLQHILRLVIKKELADAADCNIVVDINSYKNKKTSNLEKRVRDAAYKVRTTGIVYEFEPMSSYERRLVHTLVSNFADVESESVGEKHERKVHVKPKK